MMIVKMTAARCVRWLVVLGLVFSLHDTVVVAQEYVNVAKGKPTFHIDTYMDRDSKWAVDGNRSPEVHISCTFTISQNRTFWVVDLLAVYQIHSINITNRDLYSDRLHDFSIYVSGENPLPIPSTDGSFAGQLCTAYPGILPANGPHLLPCQQDVFGRYVYLWKPEKILTICEFEVMVEKDKLDPDVRKESFGILQGMKSSESPFYTETVDDLTRFKCIRTCLSAPGGSATLVQMDISSNLCECIQESGFETPSPDVLNDGWTLMKSLRN